MVWRDISSAPKDGSRIDLWADGKRLANCWWKIPDFDDVGCWYQAWSEIPFGSFRIDKTPTHWMPLPDPPEAAPPVNGAAAAAD